jgi:hypothetical protein
MDNKMAQQLKRKAIEEEAKKNETKEPPSKRSRKQQAQGPQSIDQLFSAGGDTLPEDSETSRPPSSAADKKGRTGRPRTNFSFTR